MKQSKARKHAERLKKVDEESDEIVNRRKDGKKRKETRKGARYEDAKETSAGRVMETTIDHVPGADITKRGGRTRKLREQRK